MSVSRRHLAWGGVAGPAAFVVAWSILGERVDTYSPVEEPISRLAAAGAPTQTAMTAGFIAFGAGVSMYAAAARTAFSTATAIASGLTAAATLGIAALPLGSARGDRAHAIAAAVAYAALSATQMAGARDFARRGFPLAARLSAAAGVATAIALAASAAGTPVTGLLQRTGLTIGDTWIAATSASMLLRQPRRTTIASP